MSESVNHGGIEFSFGIQIIAHASKIVYTGGETGSESQSINQCSQCENWLGAMRTRRERFKRIFIIIMSCALNTFSFRFVARRRRLLPLSSAFVVPFLVSGSRPLAVASDGDYYCRSCAFCTKGTSHAILIQHFTRLAHRNALWSWSWTTQVEPEIGIEFGFSL